MAVDDRFKVTGEAAVEQSRGTARFGGCDDFGEQTTGASGNGGPYDGHGARFGFDDDLRAQADVRHQTGEVADGFSFRDVDRCHTHDDTSILHPTDEDLSVGTPILFFHLAAASKKQQLLKEEGQS
jgi:hypothetical protein